MTLINPAAADIIQSELGAGEHFLWAGKPARFPFSSPDLIIIAASSVLLIVAIFGLLAGTYFLFDGTLAVEARKNGDAPAGVYIATVCATLLLAIVCFLFLRQGLKDFTGPSRDVYALTYKRGIIFNPMQQNPIVTIPPKLLKTVRRSGNQKIGTLTFRYLTTELLLQATFPLLKPLAFHDIASPTQVERLIIETFSKDRTP